ncbi:RING finger protein 141 [Nilaparvata lugens]|uniref:RING finger protein 141 n=1 Tax=Nilaparvata lugens TaxID=108931 RepID=UPI00193D15CC|nr:RING finger protein 141 [Nilaparvata lugens]
MGQNGSSSEKGLVSEVVDVQEEIVRHARSFTEIATLSYDDLKAHLDQLNTLSQQCMDSDGMQLIFAIQKGTDSSALFWKSRVRIVCIKIDLETKEIDSYRVMSLNEFLKVFKSLNNQCMAAQCISSCEEATEEAEDDRPSTSAGQGVTNDPARVTNDPLTASRLMREVDRVKNDCDPLQLECCICFERKPNTMLPCTHAYCKQCIEQWNMNHKTYTICREEVKSNDDSWVISEAPNSLEISEEIASTLMDIVGSKGQ